MNKQTISNGFFLGLLLDKQPYDVSVQSVIYSALEYYSNLKKNDKSLGAYFLYCIKERIREKAIYENDVDGYMFDHQEAKRILIKELVVVKVKGKTIYPKKAEHLFFEALEAFGKSESDDDDKISKKEKKIAKQIIEEILVAERSLMN